MQNVVGRDISATTCRAKWCQTTYKDRKVMQHQLAVSTNVNKAINSADIVAAFAVIPTLSHLTSVLCMA